MRYIEILGAALIFVLIVSFDLFVFGFSYGVSKVHVPTRKVFIINILGSIIMGAGMLSGFFLGHVFQGKIAIWISFGAFLGLGLFKIIGWLASSNKESAPVKPISWTETVMLGVLLSIDEFIIGLGGAIANPGLAFILTTILLSIIAGHVVFTCGQFAGKKLTAKTQLNLSWVSGVAMLVMAGLAVLG